MACVVGQMRHHDLQNTTLSHTIGAPSRRTSLCRLPFMFAGGCHALDRLVERAASDKRLCLSGRPKQCICAAREVVGAVDSDCDD